MRRWIAKRNPCGLAPKGDPINALPPTLAGELNPGRDRGAILDALFPKFATRVAASPHQQQNVIAIVVLRKI
jgi:hypothetical protein